MLNLPLISLDGGVLVTTRAVAKKKDAKAKAAFNPHDLPLVTVLEPVGPESVDEFWSRLQGNWQILAASCVTVSSRVTYNSAWKHWLSFCERLGAVASLSTPFPRWDQSNSVHSYQVTMIISFIAYLQAKRPRLRPGTVDDYISGLRHCLMQLNVEGTVFKAQIITQCRASLNLQQRILHPENEDKTLPFLAEWFSSLRRLVSLTTVKSFMIVVALELSFVCLLRSSEVLITSDDHFLRACDVSFLFKLPSSSEPVWVSPSEVYLYELDHLIGVSIKIRSAKNDQGGRGYRYYYERNPALSSDAAFDLVVDMYLLSKAARPVGEAAFFSYNDYVLPYHKFNATIKLVAKSEGQDPSRYSCHSMRIGGATLLAAAHFPDYIIQNMGRWKSLAFLHYLHWAPSMMSSALTALIDPSIFTLKDLQKMNAGVSI